MLATPLTGRVIVITGASSGIGAATALACAQAGMDVVLGARREDRLQTVADRVRNLGRRAVALTCDVDRDADVQSLIDAAMRQFGRLDVAFANAGYGLFSSVLATSDAQMRAILETNFHGTLRLVRAAAPLMIQARAGHLLICSSCVSEIGLPMSGAYAATKAAQDAVAGALRAELAPHGIHVTSVHPATTRTEFFDHSQRNQETAMVPPGLPRGPSQSPQQVARCILRAIRRPRPEVWPQPGIRFGMAAMTAFPRLAAWAMRGYHRRILHTHPELSKTSP